MPSLVHPIETIVQSCLSGPAFWSCAASYTSHAVHCFALCNMVKFSALLLHYQGKEYYNSISMRRRQALLGSFRLLVTRRRGLAEDIQDIIRSPQSLIQPDSKRLTAGKLDLTLYFKVNKLRSDDQAQRSDDRNTCRTTISTENRRVGRKVERDYGAPQSPDAAADCARGRGGL